MVPALEEVQQALNRAVDCVVSVSKGVGQWSKERITKVPDMISVTRFKSVIVWSMTKSCMSQRKMSERRQAALAQESSESEPEDGTPTYQSVAGISPCLIET